MPLLLVASLLLVARPGATSSVLAPGNFKSLRFFAYSTYGSLDVPPSALPSVYLRCPSWWRWMCETKLDVKRRPS